MTTELEDQVRELFSRQSAAITEDRIAAVAGQDYYLPRKRRVWPLATTGIGVAAATAAVLLTVGGTANTPSAHHTANGAPSPSTDASIPAPSTNPVAAPTNTIELAGYRIALPANYKVGKAAATNDTNCTKNLHLSAESSKRLITTPNSQCPVLITSVLKDVPAGAEKHVLPGCYYHAGAPEDSCDPDPGLTLTIYDVTEEGLVQAVYIPAQLPDGSAVYVTLDWASTAGHVAAKDLAIAQSTSSGQVVVVGDRINQLLELEHGLHVERALPVPPDNGQPKG
jgi:hypothetical protein